MSALPLGVYLPGFETGYGPFLADHVLSMGPNVAWHRLSWNASRRNHMVPHMIVRRGDASRSRILHRRHRGVLSVRRGDVHRREDAVASTLELALQFDARHDRRAVCCSWI
jgi:hypothetical protein